MQSTRHLAPVLVSEGNPTQDCFKKRKRASMVSRKGRKGIDRVKKSSPGHTVITQKLLSYLQLDAKP